MAYLSLPPTAGTTDISWSLGGDIVSSSTLFEWSGEEGEGTWSATHLIDRASGLFLVKAQESWWDWKSPQLISGGQMVQELSSFMISACQSTQTGTPSPRKLGSGKTWLIWLDDDLFFRTVELVQEPLAVGMDVKKVKTKKESKTFAIFSRRDSPSTSRSMGKRFSWKDPTGSQLTSCLNK